jgi:hypothetical protein
MKIIDNCTNHFIANELEKIFLDQYTSWLYDPTTAGQESLSKSIFPNARETFQFVHPIMDNGRHDSLYTPLILELGNKIFFDLKISIINYRRIKVNQLLKSIESSDNYHPPHVDDLEENMLSLIYYINDSDGPTYFFNKQGTCTDKVYPKKNRCVLFPSNVFHASSSPILSDRRLVINFVAATDLKINL